MGATGITGMPWADVVWRHLEPLHALVYFAPEHRAACDRLGLTGGWMAYFASRSAPLGPVPADVVVATFYNFHPRMVRRALPDAWSHTTPHDMVATRYDAIDGVLDRVLAEHRQSDWVRSLAEWGRRRLAGHGVEGRPLFAANAALEWPPDPALALWHTATLIREHRGDGHVAVLVAEGIDGCQAHVLQVARGRISAEAIRAYRGWGEHDWRAAEQGLVDRGLLEGGGRLTVRGQRFADHVDRRTSELSSRLVGTDDVDGIAGHLSAVAGAVATSGDIPYPNPMGVPQPDG